VIGNQALLRRLQPRLTVGAVNDPLEAEADRAADTVMRMGTPLAGLNMSPPVLSRKCAACEDEDKELRTKSAGADMGGMDAPAQVESVLRGPGQPLDAGLRDHFEPRFGRDFSSVRIHQGAAAADSARSVGALAYTVGADIVFGAGSYAPAADSGRRLIAHELAHTVQQGAGATLRRSPITDCLAQKDEILPPHVGLVTVIAREQELADKLGPDYEPFKKLILERVDARTVVCQHGVPGVLALWNTRTPQKVIDVPAATASLFGVAAPAAPTPTAVPAVTPAPGPDDFEINRVGGSTASQLFFARGSDAITPSAQARIDQLKPSHPAGVRLIGYTSTDEAASLAQSRADAVKAALANPPDAIAVTSAVGNAAANVSKSDFVHSRSVDVVIGSAAPTTVDCAATNSSGNPVNPPRQPCPTMDPPTWTAFQSVHALAKDAMADAVAAVAGSPSADDAAKIDKFFGGHDAATLAKLQTNLGALNTHVINLPAETDCGGACDKICKSAEGVIAYNNAQPAASHTTVCVPTFKEHNSDNDRARNLIHETAHGTLPLGGAPNTGTQDVAYRHERMLLQIPPADRLRNSDSYALFAMFVHEAKATGNPNAVPQGISTPANDKLNGFAPTDPETPALNLALAKLEKRLAWVTTEVGQLNGQIVDIRAGGLTWAHSWANGLMTEASKHFPLTPPPATPTLTDQIRVAGMEDRYLRMSAASKHDLTVTRAAAGAVTWAPPAASSPFLAAPALSIGPEFFRAPPEDQISLLLEPLARNTRDVEPAFAPAYVSLAKWIHDQNP